jgi:hypothetical protein
LDCEGWLSDLHGAHDVRRRGRAVGDAEAERGKFGLLAVVEDVGRHGHVSLAVL